jgi:hypothetical protein
MFSLPHFIAANSRRLIAIGAIAISLIAALGLATASQSSSQIWAASHLLAPGSLIGPSDIVRIDANLGTSAKNYYSGKAKLIGNTVRRPVGPSEFIPLNAIAQAGSVSDYRQLPLGIGRSDLPSDLAPGERVDLYSIPKDVGSAPSLVATGIHVQSVDSKSRDLGGAVTVLFLLHEKEIAAVIDSLTSGRILVVRNAL